MSKKKKRNQSTDEILDDMDDRFAFIAGYTPGGFPYGTTWEELGIDQDLPIEKKRRLYDAAAARGTGDKRRARGRGRAAVLESTAR